MGTVRTRFAVRVLLLVVAVSSSALARDPVWISRYGDENINAPTAMKLDGAGNAYMVGIRYPNVSSWDSSVPVDTVLVKFDPTGVRQWVAQYHDEAGMWAEVEGLAVDAVGNAYVLAVLVSPLDSAVQSLIVKYDTTGQVMWKSQVDGAFGCSIVVDESGSIYVGGYLYRDSKANGVTMKFNADGTEAWRAVLDNGELSASSVTQLALAPNGDVVACGGIWNDTEGYGLVMRYTPSGERLWMARHNVTAGNWEDLAEIAADSTGNVIVTGSSGDRTVDHGWWFSNQDYLTIKYSPDGIEEWTACYDGPGHFEDVANALTVDQDDNIIVTGGSSRLIEGASGDSSQRSGYATIKYSPEGQILWIRRFDKPGGSLGGWYVTADSERSVYVTGAGSMDDTGGLGSRPPRLETVKYGPDGGLLWIAEYGAFPCGLELDNAGHLYVAAHSSVDSGTDDFALIQYPAAGDDLTYELWDAGTGEGDTLPWLEWPDNADGDTSTEPACGPIGLLPFSLCLLPLARRR